MRIACKPGSEVPEHLNLSRTPAPLFVCSLDAIARRLCICARPLTDLGLPDNIGLPFELIANCRIE
jgi:hypothetical protein